MAAAPTAPEVPPGPVAITVDGKRLDFRFTRPTGAAAFLDAGVMTLVFDTRDTIDPAKLAGLMPKLIEEDGYKRQEYGCGAPVAPVVQAPAYWGGGPGYGGYPRYRGGGYRGGPYGGPPPPVGYNPPTCSEC